MGYFILFLYFIISLIFAFYYSLFYFYSLTRPVSWGGRILRLHLCRGVSTPHPTNQFPGYDTKQSEGEDGALGNAEYPFIAIAPGVAALDRVLSMGQIELFDL